MGQLVLQPKLWWIWSCWASFAFWIGFNHFCAKQEAKKKTQLRKKLDCLYRWTLLVINQSPWFVFALGMFQTWLLFESLKVILYWYLFVKNMSRSLLCENALVYMTCYFILKGHVFPWVVLEPCASAGLHSSFFSLYEWCLSPHWLHGSQTSMLHSWMETDFPWTPSLY